MLLSCATSLLAVVATTAIAAAQNLSEDPTHSIRSFPRSPGAPNKYTKGHITCHVLNNGPIYNVLADASEFGVYLLSNASDPLVVEFDLEAANAGPVNLIAKTGTLKESFPYVGAINGLRTSPRIRSGDLSAWVLGGTERTEIGEPTTAGSNSFLAKFSDKFKNFGMQSAIWRYDADNGYLIPELVSSNGATYTTHVAYHPLNDFIILTANFRKFRNHYKTAQACQLKFNPIIEDSL